MEPEILLKYAVKGLNDSIGTDALVPSLLVFGALPTFPFLNMDIIPGQRESFEMMKLARDKVAQLRAEQRIATAVNTNVPLSANYILKTGDRVSAYSQNKEVDKLFNNFGYKS